MSDITKGELYTGCLLGGAVGDALGWPVEFLSMSEIRRKFGPDGIQDFVETAGEVGAITDDTQMTLFTAEGLLREYQRSRETGDVPDYPSSVYRAYLRWLHTQGETSRDPNFRDCLDGELLKVEGLHHRRAPGSTWRHFTMIQSPSTALRSTGKVKSRPDIASANSWAMASRPSTRPHATSTNTASSVNSSAYSAQSPSPRSSRSRTAS